MRINLRKMQNKIPKIRHKKSKIILTKLSKKNKILKKRKKILKKRSKITLRSNQVKSQKRRNHVSAQLQSVRMLQLSTKRTIDTNSNTTSKAIDSVVKHVMKLHNKNNCLSNSKTKSVKLERRLKPKMIWSPVFMTSDDHTMKNTWSLSEQHKKFKT